MTTASKPTLREMAKAHAKAMTLARKRSQHFNSDGVPDSFSTLIRARLAALNLTLAAFADNTDAVTVASSVAKKEHRGQTSRSLVTRVLLGQRALPLGRAVSWAKSLKLTDPEKRQQFLVITLIAGGLRDVRRNLSTQNRSRHILITQLTAALDAHIAAFRWGNDK